MFLLGLCCILMTACSSSNSEINNELFPVQSGEKYGYINKKGEFVIQPQFKNATPFVGDIALVQDESEMFGYINMKGEYVIKPEYDEATIFHEGIAWVVKPEGYPIAINARGEELFSAKFAENVGIFCEGFAVYQDVETQLYGYLNTKGEVVIKPIYVSAKNFFEGMAVAATQGSKFGYINTKGEWVINPQFKIGFDFSNGKTCVSNEKDSWGVIDKKGTFVINPQFDILVPDRKDYIIQQEGSKKMGTCDEKGKIIINPQFDNMGAFGKNNLAPVKVGERWGYVDKEGKIVINPQFKIALSFEGDIAFVSDDNHKIGIIDKEGKYVVNPQFDEINYFTAFPIGSMITMGFLPSSVNTHYFDIESTVKSIKAMISPESVDGLNFQTTIKGLMEKYDLKTYSIKNNKTEFQAIYSKSLNKNANYTIFIGGDFYKINSNSYWPSYNLDEATIPQAYACNIALRGSGEGKSKELYAALLKAYNMTEKNPKIKNSKGDNFSIVLSDDVVGIVLSQNEVSAD